MGRRAGPGGVVIVAAIAAAVVSAAPQAPSPPKEPAAPAALRVVPKSRRMSTYTLGARFEITTRDITFEAPAAYQSGFDFWAGRMKGQRKSEVCEMVTVTQDADPSGDVVFRRTIPKYDVELEKQGQIYASERSVERTVAALQWEGRLDPFGNVKEMHKVAGDDGGEVADLAIPEMSRVFPEMKGPLSLKVGDSFKEERIVRLPTKLGIKGLEHVTVQWVREYILKAQQDGVATFEVKTTYANDPAFKPEMDGTTCQIGGGGSGEALFEIKRGVFARSRVPTTMHIDIEAPLRPLPDQPATNVTSVGKSHIQLDLLLSGEQTVKRTWGDDTD
jgi:hypothetical protein